MRWTAVVLLQFLIACGVLAWSAKRFVHLSSILAKRYGMPSFLIGVLLIGFGTSFPELIVSAAAALKHNAGIAIGNAIGSNITNIGLVVGMSALLSPITVHSRFVKREFPILLIVMLIVGALMHANHHLSRIDGVCLFALLVAYLLWILHLVRDQKTQHDSIVKESIQVGSSLLPTKRVVCYGVLSLMLLLLASEVLVNSAIHIARWMHVSDFVIGLTVVAIGTSLPELATTLVSVSRGENDIAIGSIVGSNIFNLLGVLLMPALIVPSALPTDLLFRDYPVMLILTILLWVFALLPTRHFSINRIEGLILLTGFGTYLVWSILGH